MVAGDVGLVLAGTYPQRVSISKSGKSGSLITFKTEGTVSTHGFKIIADYIRIDGFTIPYTPPVTGWDTTTRSTGAGVFLIGNYCEIVNNIISNTSCIGIDIYNNSPDSSLTSHCLVQNNTITRAGLCAISIHGRNHIIDGNDLSHTLKTPASWSNPPSGADADGIRFFGSGHIISNNKIHDIYLSEGNTGAHIDCFQTWGPAYDIVFDSNYCSNTDYAMQGFTTTQIYTPVRDLTIQNSIFTTSGACIDINNLETYPVIPNTKIYHNLLNKTTWYAVHLNGAPYSEVLNNLFLDCGNHNQPYVSSDTAATIGYNCVFMTDGKMPAGSPYPNDLWQVDPKLVDFKNNDFNLQVNSPLIDAGKSITGVILDYYGRSRPQGKGLDIGPAERPTIPGMEDIKIKVVNP
ncbi:MAG: choice-of-anchor Q domain-containing protein [Desulfatirhabdiaceae bacterium]